MKASSLRYFLLPALAAGIISLTAGAQVTTPEKVRAEMRANPGMAAGLDQAYDMSVKPSTPAPCGYEPVYVSHYGRHGSRYAYTAKAYTVPLELLRRGAEADNLTDYGKALYKELSAFWEHAEYKVGDLTPLGWEQHQFIASTMVHSFPSAFRKGSTVDACSSASVRSIVSMASFCAAVSREAPRARVYAHQGKLDIQATRPNEGKNPFAYTGPDIPFPYKESSEQFFLRRFPGYNDVLARVFKDTATCLGKTSAYDAFFNIYMLVAGQNSIPEEERIGLLRQLLTDEEYAILWETDNYERFREYFPYRTPCSSIVDDIVAKADGRLSAGSRGADLRFGHDHVLMTLLMIMDIAGFGNIPESGDDLAGAFRSTLSPMGTNLQFVFYRPRCGRKGETLVKVLLNGAETNLGGLTPVKGPYYKWPEVRDYLNMRTNLFVNR